MTLLLSFQFEGHYEGDLFQDRYICIQTTEPGVNVDYIIIIIIVIIITIIISMQDAACRSQACVCTATVSSAWHSRTIHFNNNGCHLGAEVRPNFETIICRSASRILPIPV